MCKGKCAGHMIGMTLLIIGGLNWGLVGINPDWNLVNMLLGSIDWLERLVYILVGLSALMVAVGCKCKKCKGSCATGMKKEMPSMGGDKM